MDVMEAIKSRKSVRGYLDRPVEEDKLQRVLEAGRLAPSARNDQSWKFVVVSDPQLRQQLVPVCHNQQFVGEAPVVLVVCADNQRDMLCQQPARTVDCSIALSFMILEAAAQGLGTCWLGMFDAGLVGKLLNIPPDYVVVAVAPLGYPAENATIPTPRKSLEEIVVRDRWS